MSVVAFVMMGLIAGLLARAVVRGRQTMGFGATMVLGTAGSLIGGLLGNLLTGRSLLELHASGIMGSVIGALLLLVVIGASAPHRRPTL